jgi:hypothetical protein
MATILARLLAYPMDVAPQCHQVHVGVSAESPTTVDWVRGVDQTDRVGDPVVDLGQDHLIAHLPSITPRGGRTALPPP